MQAQIAPVRLDELAKRLPVSVPDLGNEVPGRTAIFA